MIVGTQLIPYLKKQKARLRRLTLNEDFNMHLTKIPNIHFLRAIIKALIKKSQTVSGLAFEEFGSFVIQMHEKAPRSTSHMTRNKDKN